VTEAEVAAMVGWLRAARNPQRERKRPGSASPGSVNLKTGKPSLRAGYAPSTINHTLTVVHGFYSFHGRFGAGPVMNPVPVSAQRRQVLAHRSPLEPVPLLRRARLRQRVPRKAPRAIPDHLWDELFAAMGCDRDRALLEFYVSSGARASELLGVTVEDIDWGGQLIYVVSKGTRVRQPVPASPDAFRYLGHYLAADGLPPAGQPVWRTRRGGQRPMTYWAMRRVLQRANDRLGTNWSLHDARHTAAARMAGDERLTLAEVQTILRHAHLDTTGHYLVARIEDMHDKLQEHYTRPRPQRSYPAGYDSEDVKAVFGG
jgi:integrase